MRHLLALLLFLPACAPVGSTGGTPPVDQGVHDAGITTINPDADITSIDPDAAVADAAPDASVPDASPTIGVATFNVQRFFDMTCNSGRCGPDDFEAQFDQRDFDTKAEDVARAIVRLHVEHGADVIMLQELENDLCLEHLQIYLDRFEAPFTVSILGETHFAGSMDVAIVARGEHQRTITHRENPIYRPDGSRTQFSRELLEVHLSIDGYPVVAFSAHFKSKFGDDAGRRIAEARATREILHEAALANPEALVVLGGDLNDTPGSDTLNDLEESGYFDRVAAELGEEAATYVYFDERSAIDHIYHAHEASGRYQPGSAQVVRSTGQNGLVGSDHAALAARFAL